MDIILDLDYIQNISKMKMMKKIPLIIINVFGAVKIIYLTMEIKMKKKKNILVMQKITMKI